MIINTALRNKLKKGVLEQLKNPAAREIIIKSPYPLTSAEMQTLQKSADFLSHSQMVNEVDPSLIGGLVILDGSRIIDLSVKGKLNDIVDSLLQS